MLRVNSAEESIEIAPRSGSSVFKVAEEFLIHVLAFTNTLLI